MRRLGFWLTLLAILLVGIACSSKEPAGQLADGCVINTDCAAPLVCAFRRCHEACDLSRDCKLGARCVVSQRPLYVCQLADELNCSYNSDCAAGQACGIDSQCRDQCLADSDCLGDQSCTHGTCADKVELREGGLLFSAPDAAADASSGQTCLYTSECDPPLICRARTCTRECITKADCPADSDCVNSRCVDGSGTLIGPLGGVVSAFGGKITLTIPPGSLPSTVSIAILAVDAWPAGALGFAFRIEPTGLRFNAGATLAYRYEASEISAIAPTGLRLANAVGSTWAPLDSTLDVATSKVSAQLAHLSIYGLIGPSASDGGPLDASTDGRDDGGGCAAEACSGALADGCCPLGCNATNDADCAGCGNGHLDPGETCDPPASCPSSCPSMGCQRFTLANAGTCQAACVAAGLATQCDNGDGCCPSGCNSGTDSDCSPVCGNGVVEPGEMCDGNCPSKCAPVGCQQTVLQGSAATCNARCVNGAVQTACVAGDACCPASCNATTDADCVPRCGNGIVEAGEICDGNCPTSCPAVGCQLRVPAGDSASCNVQCVNGALQAACINNDGCCPAGCTTRNDNDCQPVCGNGVVDTGETCDPVAACTTVQTACVNNANTVVTTSGSAAACTFVCTRKQRACGASDTFCPTNVACGPTSDVDCPGCGNGRIEAALGETCDPPSACTTQLNACVSDANNVRTSSGSVAACTYRCTTATRTCGPSDGFCPSGCGPTQDVDCPGCGNGRIEAGETCDVAPAAVTCASLTCNDGNACTTDTTSGSSATCNVTCTHTSVTKCINLDGCCPAGCNATNDSDCGAVCGNGVREGTETCEVAPATPLCTGISCDDGNACTTDTKSGTNAACNVACAHAAVTQCVNGDKCCPGGGRGTCNANNDTDCAPLCGNGVVEGKETCEVAPGTPLCSSITCDDGNACTTDTKAGSSATCDLTCSHTAITACSLTKDGCCPTGCNANTDADCAAVCGNAILEAPAETCDTGIRGSCPTACAQQACVVPALVYGGTCQAACVDQGKRQTACVDGDGCCPAGCTDYSDSDCPTKNDLCANALDISAGGDFPFSLLKATEDLPGFCSANAPEVFFTFQLPAPALVYLDVFDPAGSVVNVALELYLGGCPASGAQPIACDTVNGARCGDKAAWPRIFDASAQNGTYTVAARVLNGLPGRYTLRFQRVPLACVVGGAMPATEVIGACSQQDQFTLGCSVVSGGQDRAYYMEKCASTGLSVDTCSGRTGNSDTVLQVNEGSIDMVGGKCVLASSARSLACNDDAPCASTQSPLTSSIVNTGRGERGLFTVVVDGLNAATGCTYGFNSTVLP